MHKSRPAYLRVPAVNLRPDCLDEGHGRTPLPMRADDPLGIGADDPKCMAGGAILDPNDGKIYQLSATCEPDRTLHARISKDILLFAWHGARHTRQQL